MKYKVDLQIASHNTDIPNRFLIQRWVNEALTGRMVSGEVCIRIVDEEEMRKLNGMYRNKNKPTNVLSFPYDVPEDVELEKPLLGDIVICAPVIANEAFEQNKSLEAHWAHMVIHGTLHLLGYDHVNNKDAEVMENIEIQILSNLGHQNPYIEGDDINNERP